MSTPLSLLISALDAGNIDLHHIAMRPLIIDLTEHDQPDQGRAEHEGEHRIAAVLPCHNTLPPN
jgi:hypothetical protein